MYTFTPIAMASVFLLATALALFADEAAARPEKSGLLFQENFDDADYPQRFTSASHAANRSLADGGAVGDHAVRIGIPEGSHNGASLNYRFARAGHDEPEVLYARYYLRFGDTWVPGNGGKLPGPAGTYDRAGWGGRVADGTNGWSARMGFRQCRQHPDRTQLFFYTYHADMRGRWGSNFIWDVDHKCLENNRWYRIDMETRLNSPGENDGVLRGWIDGELAMEKTDVRFRDTPDLKIEQFWMNMYYGGSWTAPHDMHVDWDGVMLSTEPLEDLPVSPRGSGAE